ncbi:MAG: aldehyde dehydrogenase family protein [Synergistaceae bacterium]|nr:aldehyde dehydrogenase family protein [Synergistaceae bacterium]
MNKSVHSDGAGCSEEELPQGDVRDFDNFVNAVIDEKAFDGLVAFIERARHAPEAEIIAGGGYDKSEGYFIGPTVIRTDDPHFIALKEELFGPVLTVSVYNDDAFDGMLELWDGTSPYALTGAIFARDRSAVQQACRRLRYGAGNFYINDKPTGAVAGQQPFGGSRRSGTNDKAGSALNLLRWISPRTIKENLLPLTHEAYGSCGDPLAFPRQ